MSPVRRARLLTTVRKRKRLHNKLLYLGRLTVEPLEARRLLAAFMPGDFVAYRISQSGPFTTAATSVFVDEFAPDGSLVQSIAMPTAVAGNQRRLTAGGLSASGPGTFEGLLTLSTDGRYLLLTGFDAAVGSSSPASAASASVNRVVARIDAQGNVDTSTIIADGYNSSSIRGAASVDGSTLWATGGLGGGTGGVRSLAFGNTGATTQLNSTTTDIRAAEIFGGQLYVSLGPGGGLIGKVGTGLPTTPGQTITTLPGITSSFLAQPDQFFMADLDAGTPGADTLYVADESTVSGKGTGLRKFSLVGGSWVYNGTLSPDGKGMRGLTGSVQNGVVTIYASGSDTSNNLIWKITDPNGWNAGLPTSTVPPFIDGTATAGYRGLALVPASAPTGTLSATIDGSGNLTIADIDPTGKNNNLTLSAAGANLVITDANEQFTGAPAGGTLSSDNKTLTIPLSSVAGSLTFNTLGGTDILTVDLSGGDAIPPGNIALNGGGPATGPGDKLIIAGGSQGIVTYNYASAHDGSVAMSSYGTVNYTGLEPIVNSGAANDVIFNLPVGPSTVTLGDDGTAGNGLSRLSSVTFETTDFANPTGSLTINRGNAADTLIVAALPDFSAGLTIGSAGSELNTVTFGGPVTLAANKSVAVNATGRIGFSSAASDLATSGTGSVSLTTGRDISFVAGSSITTVNGNLTLSANQQASSTSGNFRGIDINGGTLTTTGTGSINLAGRGGNDAATNLHMGIHIRNGGLVQSTSAAAGAGTITLTGRGGTGTTSDNDGVIIEAANSQVATVSGDVQIAGTGGSGTTTLNRGVVVLNGGQIKSTGTGATAGNIAVVGTGGTGTDSNIGVDVSGTNSFITTIDGDITMTGQASTLATGQTNYGVRVQSGGQIRSSGTGAAAGNITITGTGGGNGAAGSIQNQGVRIDGSTAEIDSVDGNVSIAGTSGSTAITSNTFEDGVRLVNAAVIHTTGAGVLTLTGTAGSTNGAVGVGLRLGGLVTLSGSQNTWIGDRMVFDTANLTVSAGTSTLVLRPQTGGTAINLGSATDTAASTLELSDAELDRIAAGTLQFGDAGSGTITVSADLTQPAKNLTLITAAGVAGSGGMINGSATATTVTINQAGNSTSSGAIGGPSGGTANDKNLGFTKLGAGTLTLSDASNYTGATTINAGRLNVNGSIGSNVSVGSAATLGGSGTINSANSVSVQSGGAIAPGNSPGKLNTGSVAFSGGSTFSVEVNGTTAGTSYDQLNVTGTVSLGGAALALSGTISTAPGVDIVLINNDGTDAVSGTFGGLPEGSLVTLNGVEFFLTYAGGTNNNDVVLTSPDISLVNVDIVDNLSHLPVTPVIGEQVVVHVNYLTHNLPVTASYRLEFSLDGVPLGFSNITSGAGLSSGAWNFFRTGWFASPGTHTVQVRLDADSSVTEVDETNNTLSQPITFSPVAPTSLPQKFINPLGGVPFHDWSFINYYDVDPTSGIQDFQGGPYAYDGHNGHDITLPNFSRMDNGIPEYAAADGTVEAVVDGNFDRNTEALNQPENSIVIDHGNGWETQYIHLAANTITVKVGDVVVAGQLLGLAGSSGNSTLAHLHFAVLHDGVRVETEFDPADYYVSPVAYQATLPTTILDAGITNFTPSSGEYDERPAEQSVFSVLTPKNVTFWFRASHFHAGDQYQVKWYRPDSALNTTFNYTSPGDQRGPIHNWTLNSGALTNLPGTWRVAVEMGGVEIVSRTFDVTTAIGAAGIKVTAQDGTIISDNRTTPFSFPTTQLGGVASSQTFTIVNHGTAPLNLTGLVLPPGFVLNGAFPGSIAAGGSAPLTIDLTSGRAGEAFGAVQFTTNDPDTPLFHFNVSGTVAGAAPAGAPVASLPAPALAYTILGQASAVDSTATVADADSATFNGGTLTVEFTSLSSIQDALGIRNAGSGPGQIGVSGSAVAFGGTSIGTFAGGIGGVPLIISFNANATPAAAQELIRNIVFSTAATHPESAARYVRFTLVDDAGNISNQPIAVVVQNLRPTTVSLDNGNLVIDDSSAAGKGDNWRLAQVGSDLVLTDLTGNAIDVSSIPGATGNGTSIVTVPMSALSASGQLLVNGRNGADQLTIDLSSGNPIPSGGITFAGGGPIAGPGDRLAITGGDQGTVAYNLQNAHDGSIVMSHFGAVNYTGLEPVVNSGAASDVVFNLPSGSNVATLGDDGIAGNGLSRLSGATFESTDFANPTNSLTINRGSASDALTISNLPDLNAALAIGSTAAPFGTLTFAGAVALAAGKCLSAAGAAVISTAAGAVTAAGGGSISLAADTVSIDGSSSFAAANGSFFIAPVTAGRQTDLGGPDSSGTLGLADLELDRITAGTLNIGNASSGTITVSSASTRPASTNVVLTTNADIVLNAGSISTGGGSLTLSPGSSGSVQPLTSGTDITTSAAAAVSFGSGADLAIVIDGAAVDSGYTQLNVAGQVNLSNVDLVVSGSYTPSPSDSFTLVSNDDTDPILGTFNGLPEGATLSVNGDDLKITYAGGTGNDVVLLPVASGPPPAAAGTTGDDTFVLRRDATVPMDFRLSINGGPDIIYHSAASIAIDGIAGNDTLIVSDTGNLSGVNATITESKIEWLTSFAGSLEMDYQNIDVLNVTGSGGNDLFDIRLNSGSDLDAMTVNGSDGADQFLLDLNTANHSANDVAGLASVTLNGDAGNDTFGSPIEPSITTSIIVGGGATTTSGVAPFNAAAGNLIGDTLNLDLTPSYANASATAIVSTVSGTGQTTGYKTISFSDTEAIHLIDNGLLTRAAMGDLYIRGTENADVIQFGPTSSPNMASARLNNTMQSLAVAGRTIVYGRGGNDTITQGTLSKPAEFYGEAGDDYLTGYKFDDLVVGGDGNDRILGGEGNNELWGDNLGEQALPLGGKDIMTAGGGSDRFYGGGGSDQITCGGGVDYAMGGAGDDTLDGGEGDDRLYGGDGNDTLYGGNGNDLVAGNSGDDKLYGKAGNDVLIGGQGADLFVGDDGNDLLFDGEVAVNNPAGTDSSGAAGDAHDVAMAALLSDWSPDASLNLILITSLHDSSIDNLGGGNGTDTASAGAGDLGDWELSLL